MKNPVSPARGFSLAAPISVLILATLGAMLYVSQTEPAKAPTPVPLSGSGAVVSATSGETGERPSPRDQSLRAEWRTDESGPSRFDARASSRETPAPEKPPVPWILVDVDADALQLTDDQKETIADLKKRLYVALGSGQVDPGSAEYLERWQKAQPMIDRQAALFLGDEAALRYQVAVSQAEQQQQQANK